MKAWKLLLPVPVVAALAMVPQDPPTADAAAADQTAVTSISELHLHTLQGTKLSYSARSVVEVRLIEDHAEHLRLELVFENGDYALHDVQGFEVLRNGPTAREVRFVRGKQARMRFPRMP